MAAAAMSPPSDIDYKVETKPTLTPPASGESDKHDGSSSELSDLEIEDDDNGEIVPDHYYEGGKVPVFKPTMDQFRSFKTFIQKIDKYGMKSGIVKVIPPKEWRDGLPALDEQVKTAIKVKNPITQEFHGTHGTYTQANIEKQRSYNLPQWKALSEESNHQPPAKRGERRRNQEKVTRGAHTRARNIPVILPDGKKRGPGRPRVRPLPTTVHKTSEDGKDGGKEFEVVVPPTPKSPATKSQKLKIEHASDDDCETPTKPRGRQPKSVSSRRKYNRRDAADVVDEEAFKNFDYRVYNQEEWTPERCAELETAYWKGLTFNNPMYGADMPGSLFDDSTTSWNVAKLENLLDVLGQKVPGVNTAYLYLGMWKATFAWHLEDVDLYSINYIHFGAPKQWYSISQEDARRFEAAMRTVWPTDAKNCDQFLRHKTYLISPALLQSQYNIRVNRLVHHEGEFVITFPYGYHSGYNLGYNCAESVNFATEAWLDYGRVARKCNCEADSVWVDVGDIERKLRGERTPEYYEETEEEDDEDEDEEDEGPTDLPTPPGSDKGKPKPRGRKRKRDDKDAKPKTKRVRIRIKAPAKEPCVLCPNDNPHEELLPTDNGQQAHRRCALYTPETYISAEGGKEKVCDVTNIDKARLELKCNYCRSKRGAVFQCSQKKCTRAYHATCAAAAGVQVDVGKVPVFAEDGTEYTDDGIDFRCRFHRSKRGKLVDGTALEENSMIKKHAWKLSAGDVVQMQYYQGDIFAGTIVENRKSEQTMLVDCLPRGDRVEVEYKWLLVFDPANSQLPVPSPNAKPLPLDLARKSKTTTQDPQNDTPKADQPFCDPKGPNIWSEFNTVKLVRNPTQVKVDLWKPKQLWFYIGRTSTEARAQYTEDPKKPRNNLEANFLESVRPLVPLIPPVQRQSYPASFPTKVNVHAINGAMVQARHRELQQLQQSQQSAHQQRKAGRPYKYTPRSPEIYSVDPQALTSQRALQQGVAVRPPISQSPNEHFRAPPAPMASMSPMVPRAPMAPMGQMMSGNHQRSPSYMKDFEDYQRWRQDSDDRRRQEQQQQQLQLQHNQIHSQQPQQTPRAPVANMMGGSTAIHNPFSNPSSSVPSPYHRRPSSSASATATNAALMNNRSGSSTHPVHPTAKYPYLHYADKKKARVYQSPYAPEGGFTALWLPNPHQHQQQTTPRSSLSQEFLLQRTPSQQEHVHQHVRQLSAGKSAVFQTSQMLQAQTQTQPNPPQAQYQTSSEFELQVRKEAEHGLGLGLGLGNGKSGYERFFEELKFAGLNGNGSGRGNAHAYTAPAGVSVGRMAAAVGAGAGAHAGAHAGAGAGAGARIT